MGAKQGQTKKSRSAGGKSRSAGLQRFALVLFGALLIALFVGFAIAQGIGRPSVPAGDIALVEGVPSDLGHVSEADFRRTMLHQLGPSGLKKLPKPGEKKYEEMKEAALNEIFDSIWLQGEAEELGIAVTPKEIATELAQIKKQNFKTKAAYQKFLNESKFTQEEVNARVKTQVLGTRIQEQIARKAPPPSEGQVADYYNETKATQFTKAESRDVRIVVNKDKKKVEEAKKLLDKDDSPASWKKVAAKYSSDPTTKTKGGLQPALTEELLQGKEPLVGAVFSSPTGVVSDLIDQEGNWFVIEVDKLNPEKVQSLKEVNAQIRTQLTQQLGQEVFSEFVSDYQSKWTSRTFCADGFVVERCANFVGSGHPSGAPATCYEADPKGGTPKECPAPVAQVSPALPGSVTLLKPQGERLPQRPRPEGLKEAAEEALPTGAAPIPTGE